jgi:hypothetical protein
MAAMGSLVSLAVDAVASYRLRTVKCGTSLGHVLNLLGESVHWVGQRQGRNGFGALPLTSYRTGSVRPQLIGLVCSTHCPSATDLKPVL